MLKIIKRINDWWIRRNTIRIPDDYIHVKGNLSKGIRMDAHAEGHASKGIRMDAHAEGFTMGQKVKLTTTEVNENDRA